MLQSGWLNLPNMLSLSRLVLAPVCVYCSFYAGWWLVAAFIIFSIAMVTDLADGYLARRYRLQTEFGNFIDPLADKLLLGSVFFVFWIHGLIGLWFVVLLFFRDMVITWLRSLLVSIGAPLKTSWIGKIKTVLQAFVIAWAYSVLIAQSFGWSLSVQLFLQHGLNVVLFVVTFFTVYSAAMYVQQHWLILRTLCLRHYGLVMCARLFATVGMLGYKVPAPGTVASICALLVMYFFSFSWIVALCLTFVLTVIGVAASDILSAHEKINDPGHIVIDEVVGMFLVLLFVPKTVVSYGLAFVLFRLFDITKPGPVRYAERCYSGGLGIMLDDIVAAGFAAVFVQVILLFL